ncbi:hypothetical protein SteCoe_85 [Stentor coeruleus]|uniref:Uncharacterized protein n=1 Tax=Stentor coeruleus TaxID=5963 RepID=A0A1R2D576_9CILI|nr:hypothetical protein SteCoe_85 [Stentor coeruleus]
MSYVNIKELVNHNIEILYPKNMKNFNKFSKEGLLPKISPKEHRELIQSPSLIRNFSKPKPDLREVKDVIERSLNIIRANNYEIKSFGKNIGIKKAKYVLRYKMPAKKGETKTKYESLKKTVSQKPIKTIDKRAKSPIFAENTLCIFNNPPKSNPMNFRPSNVLTKLFMPKKRRLSEYDEDMLDVSYYSNL